jgi:hypothetical protein
MIQRQIKYYIEFLQRENYKSFYLAFLRVAICCWLLKEVCINWTSMDILYGDSVFVVSKKNLINRLPGGGFHFVRSYYIWFIVAYIGVIFLNILGIGRQFTLLILLVMFYVLQKMNMSMVNGGDAMARLILFYLIFADSYKYFVLNKQKNVDDDKRKLQNLFSNLAALSIMFQLCLAYFSSGIAKIMEPVWLHGEATYYTLSMERFIGTPFNKYIIQHKWIVYFTNYGTLLFELLFPLLIWIKKFRKPLLITGILFHLGIYIFLMIYGFQIVFVLIYGLFLPNQKLLIFAERCKAFFWRKRTDMEANIV